MTKKNMIEILKEKEKELWYKKSYAENQYVKENFEAGYGYSNAQLTNYVRNNIELNALLEAWAEVNELLEAMGIESEYDKNASDLNNDTWLYLEARGKYEKELKEESLLSNLAPAPTKKEVDMDNAVNKEDFESELKDMMEYYSPDSSYTLEDALHENGLSGSDFI